MYRPWKFAVDQVRKRAKIRDDDSCTPSITAAAAEIFESSMTEYLSEQVQFRIKFLLKSGTYDSD